jgi:hypothetical protein
MENGDSIVPEKMYYHVGFMDPQDVNNNMLKE